MIYQNKEYESFEQIFYDMLSDEQAQYIIEKYYKSNAMEISKQLADMQRYCWYIMYFSSFWQNNRINPYFLCWEIIIH